MTRRQPTTTALGAPRPTARRWLPLFFTLEGREVLVIGGGTVATRKGLALAQAGAALTVIAPAVDDELAAIAARVERRPARMSDLTQHPAPALVVLACDRPAVQARFRAACRRLRLWCNRADAPDDSDFITAARVDLPPVSIGVTTGGELPGISRLVREILEAALPRELSQLVELVTELRPEVLARVTDPAGRTRLLRAWTRFAMLDRLARFGPTRVRQTMRRQLAAAVRRLTTDRNSCPRRTPDRGSEKRSSPPVRRRSADPAS